MPYIDDIQYDHSLYERGTYSTLLLYEHESRQASLAIPLSDANLMTFIKPFKNTAQCHRYIEGNLRKIIALFGWEKNMRHWLINNSNLPTNLQEIKIFCDRDDQGFVDAWVRRYLLRSPSVKIEVISYDMLNNVLMLYGIGHLKKLHVDFEPNSREHDQLRYNYKQICRALANHFWHEANAL